MSLKKSLTGQFLGLENAFLPVSVCVRAERTIERRRLGRLKPPPGGATWPGPLRWMMVDSTEGSWQEKTFHGAQKTVHVYVIVIGSHGCCH